MAGARAAAAEAAARAEAAAARAAEAAKKITEIANIVGLGFDGKGRLEAVLRKIETTCRIYPHGAEHKLAVLWLKLEGDALEYAERQDAETRSSFDLLKATLLAQYGDRKTTNELVRDLVEARQGENESVRDFIGRVERIAHDATPQGLNEQARRNMEGQYALQAIKAGLNRSLIERLTFADMSTYELAKENAIKAEASLLLSKSHVSDYDYPLQEVQHMQGRGAGRQSTLGRPPRGQYRPAAPPFLGQRGPPANAQLSTLTCYQCGGQGHRKNQCPSAPWQARPHGGGGQWMFSRPQAPRGQFNHRPQGNF